MKDTIDVLEILQSQHTEVDQLIEQIEAGVGDRAALFDQLADKIAAHSTVEEKIFYPAAMDGKTEDLLHICRLSGFKRCSKPGKRRTSLTKNNR